jgi:hypothetical protein
MLAGYTIAKDLNFGVMNIGPEKIADRITARSKITPR